MSDTPSGTPSDGTGSGPTGTDASSGAHRPDASHEQQYAPPGQQYPPPGQQYPPGGQYGGQYGQYGGPPPQQGNGLAVTGLVLGILAVLFAFIPFLGVIFGVLLGVLAAVFGGLGMARAGQPGRGGKGMAIAGLVLGIIGLLLGLGQGVFWGSAADDINQEFQNEFGEFDEFEP